MNRTIYRFKLLGPLPVRWKVNVYKHLRNVWGLLCRWLHQNWRFHGQGNYWWKVKHQFCNEMKGKEKEMSKGTTVGTTPMIVTAMVRRKCFNVVGTASWHLIFSRSCRGPFLHVVFMLMAYHISTVQWHHNLIGVSRINRFIKEKLSGKIKIHILLNIEILRI